MTKIALITDQHFGLKNDDESFHEKFKEFYKNTFFPTLLKHNITRVIHLGDVFHSKRKIDAKTLKVAQTCFFDKLAWHNIELDVIVGNHDVYNVDDNILNTPRVLLYGSYPNINIYDTPTEVERFGEKLCFVPWINKHNFEDVLMMLNDTTAKYCFGHFEFKGFKFNKMTLSQHGMGTKLFKKFKSTFSGHYHSKSSKDDIHYLGAPTQHTWIDANEDKGFHIFDTETGEIEFIVNPYEIFKNVSFPPKEEVDFEIYKNMFIRVYPNEVHSASDLQQYVKQIEQYASEVTIIENFRTLEFVDSDDSSDEEITIDDMDSIIKNYVVSIDNIDHSSVYTILNKSYNEAINTI